MFKKTLATTTLFFASVGPAIVAAPSVERTLRGRTNPDGTVTYE